jgi:hypothetical protein
MLWKPGYLSRYSDGLWAGRSGFDSRLELQYFFTPQRPDRLWGPPSFLSNVLPAVLSPGLKRQEHEADHSPAFIAEVRNTRAIPPLPHMISWGSA